MSDPGKKDGKRRIVLSAINIPKHPYLVDLEKAAQSRERQKTYRPQDALDDGRDKLLTETLEAVAKMTGKPIKYLPTSWRKLAIISGLKKKGMPAVYSHLDDIRQKIGLPRALFIWYKEQSAQHPKKALLSRT